MALPNTHTPDDEWAEERVKRMMEPEAAVEQLSPGDQVAPPKYRQPTDTLRSALSLDISVNPVSDDGVDDMIQAAGSKDTLLNTVAAKLADPATDKAVEDILKSDGDTVIDSLDKITEKLVIMKPNLWERLKNDVADWWDNPRKRNITIGVLILLIIAVFSFPASRAFSLNLVGVRSTVVLQVLDGSTTLPLKNAMATLAGQSAVSDANGQLTLRHIRLGSQQLVVRKSAFANYSAAITIKMGSMTLSPVSLKAIGTQVSFNLTDYVSGKPVVGAELTTGQASALSDTAGKAILTVPPSDASSLDIQVNTKGYRTERLANQTNLTSKNVVLVPAGKDVFISKQTGKYDLYSADIDGANRTVIVAATGTETQALDVSVNGDGSKAALVSTRDNQHNSDGYLLSTLSVVDIGTGANQTVDHAEQITILGWSAGKVVYSETVAGASAANPNRQRIISYDGSSAKRQQLAAANYFNTSSLIGDMLYYAVSSSDPNASANFIKITSDGTGKQILLNQEVYSGIRTSYSGLSLQIKNGWQSYIVGAAGTKTTVAPGNYTSHIYTPNSSSTQALWVDSRDGKGVLISTDLSSQKETILTSQQGLTNPVRWLNDTTVLYQITTPQETADYVVSSVGGAPKKIADVTATTATAQ